MCKEVEKLIKRAKKKGPLIIPNSFLGFLGGVIVIMCVFLSIFEIYTRENEDFGSLFFIKLNVLGLAGREVVTALILIQSVL